MAAAAVTAVDLGATAEVAVELATDLIQLETGRRRRRRRKLPVA